MSETPLEPGLELVSAVFMEDDMFARVERAIRKRRKTEGVVVTLSADFDRLCDALDATEGMGVREAFEFLRETGAQVPMDSQLKVWWLRAARDRLISLAQEVEARAQVDLSA